MFLMNRYKQRCTLVALAAVFFAITPAITSHANTWKLDANNNWHFYDRAGTELKNLRVRINYKWYYFNNDGIMVRGWFLEKSGRWYYFDASGAALTGWHKIDGKDYYFRPDAEGSLFTNGVTLDGYVVDKYGAWTGETASYTAKSTEHDAVVREVLNLVNSYRADIGLAPLTLNQKLNQISDIRAVEIDDLFAHSRPSGTIEDLFDQYGYDWGFRSENIAEGQTSVEDVMTSWMHSEGHRANILSPNATEIGIGYYVHNNRAHWVQTFAAPR